MDRETLLSEIDDGPVRVHMNDGQSVVIEGHRDCAVDSMTAYVLYRDDADGRIKAHWLSLLAMTRIERITTAA